MEKENNNTIYEMRMAEIEKMKEAIEKQIIMSKNILIEGNLIVKNRHMEELKKVLKEIKRHYVTEEIKEMMN